MLVFCFGFVLVFCFGFVLVFCFGFVQGEVSVKGKWELKKLMHQIPRSFCFSLSEKELSFYRSLQN